MTARKKRSPRELLEDVLKLIARDIDEIEKQSEAGKLEGDVAATLVRYSDALLKIVKDTDEQENAERERLSNLSDAELKEKAAQYVRRLEKK